jgi:hypothetical protein
MPTAVWSYNTTMCRAKNFTPFWSMYGAKAVLLEEIKHQSTYEPQQKPPHAQMKRRKKTCSSQIVSRWL